MLDANCGCARRAQAPGCGRPSYAGGACIPMTWRECWVSAAPHKKGTEGIKSHPALAGLKRLNPLRPFFTGRPGA
ncbi:hypothetical protein STRNTR1_0951 [Stenotrophomonas maltophilia]|nr:hypothetical protein STRNTR1_0951 [Stenotrophomonas maltophilia]